MSTARIVFLFLLAAVLPAAEKKLPALKVSANQRFLVTADGKPFFYLADTAWELFHRLDRKQAVQYLEKRASQKYTAIQAVALAELDGVTDPNPYGDLPLIDKDPTRPAITPGGDYANAQSYDYWDHVEYIIDEANRRGLYIALLPTWGTSEVDVDGRSHTVYLWTVPANVGGKWTWTAGDPAGAWEMDLAQSFQFAVGTLSFNGTPLDVKKVEIHGAAVRVTAEGPGETALSVVLEGRASGDSIKGTVKFNSSAGARTYEWKASRDPMTFRPLDPPAGGDSLWPSGPAEALAAAPRGQRLPIIPGTIDVHEDGRGPDRDLEDVVRVVAGQLPQADRGIQRRHGVPVAPVDEEGMAAPSPIHGQDDALSRSLVGGDNAVDDRRRRERMVAGNDEKGPRLGGDFPQSAQDRGQHPGLEILVDDGADRVLRDDGSDLVPVGAQNDDDVLDARPQEARQDRLDEGLPAERKKHLGPPHPFGLAGRENDGGDHAGQPPLSVFSRRVRTSSAATLTAISETVFDRIGRPMGA